MSRSTTFSEIAPPRLRQLLVLLGVWSTGFFLLCSFRPGFPFPPFEQLDTWYYTSYQWDLKALTAEFGPTYYGSRLTWILPGAWAHALLPPVAANLTFKLAASLAFATGLGLATWRLKGFHGALVAVALATLCPQMVVGLQADYTDTGVLAYGSLALACITWARESRYWPGWIFCAGVFFAFMLFANLGALTTVGLGLAVFHLAWLPLGFRRQVACIGLYVAAGALAFIGIGLISRAVGGPFNFLQPQVDMVLTLNSYGRRNPWTPADWSWLRDAAWLVLPVGALGWGAFATIRQAGSTEPTLRALTLAQAAAMLAGAALELRGVGVLAYFFYASTQLCLALPLLALCATQGLAGPRPETRSAVLIGGLLLVALCGQPVAHLAALIDPGNASAWAGGLRWFLMVGLLAGGALLSSPVLSVRLRSAGQAELLLVALALLSLPNWYRSVAYTDRLRERYLSVHAAYCRLAGEFAPGTFRYWLDASHRDGISLASTKLWEYSLFTKKTFPEFEPNDARDFPVVVPAAPGNGSAVLQRAAEALARQNLEPVDTRVLPVAGEAGTGFDLVCFRIEPKPFDPEAAPAPGDPSTRMLLGLEYYGPRSYAASLAFTGSDPASGLGLETSAGYPVFRRRNPADVATTPEQQVAPVTPARRRLIVVTVLPENGHCTLILLDQNHRELKQIVLTEKGRALHSAELPPGVTGLRIGFASRRDPRTPLPVNLNVYEVLK